MIFFGSQRTYELQPCPERWEGGGVRGKSLKLRMMPDRSEVLETVHFGEGETVNCRNVQ